ncbi:MAG: hypothetical protein M1820_007615 [Bogoriella megaspora]|nr:MAG: hypothetical protein M1820_007615 [Bogoriella megaspora]
MPADRLLGTLLRSLQSYTDQQDTPRLLGTAASLLVTLSNPLNVSLLTSQLLISPAIWERPDGLQTCLRVLSLFNSATIAKCKQQQDLADSQDETHQLGQPALSSGLGFHEWVRAVAKGADERSERYKHLVVIGGVLIGLETSELTENPESLKTTLEGALVQAANLALKEQRQAPGLGACCIALVLNHTFPVISDSARSQLDYDRLLPLLISSLWSSHEGLECGYFLGAVDLDIIQTRDNKFNWSSRSSSFRQIQSVSNRPLVSSMGPLSRLTAHAVENVRDIRLMQATLDEHSDFARSLLAQWRQIKLSEIDPVEETLYLHDDALKTSLPILWRVLKSALFGAVIILRAVVGRLLGDGAFANHLSVPNIASSILHILRNLHFISSRVGSKSFSQYTFVYLASLDVLNKYPLQADTFVKEICPNFLGHIPAHPLDRNLDLFFLDTSEHFTLVLPPETNEELLVPATSPYLVAGGNNHLLPIFEAAHSVMLSVLSAPQSATLAAKHLPFYIDALFKAFPQNLSTRQFRLAFKTLIRVITPPSPITTVQPDLPSILLELLYHRALNAPQTSLPRHPAMHRNIPAPSSGVITEEAPSPVISEREALVLTLIDSLPYLPIVDLEEWLPLVANALNSINDKEMRETCRHRFWEILNGGEMDAERSQICVAWWNTRGGRETVLFGWEDVHPNAGQSNAPMMSGALPVEESKSKL